MKDIIITILVVFAVIIMFLGIANIQKKRCIENGGIYKTNIFGIYDSCIHQVNRTEYN